MVLESPGFQRDMPTAAKRLREPDGRELFRELVYKISANFRRRERKHSGKQCATPPEEPDRATGRELPDDGLGRADCTPNRRITSLDEVLSVVRKNGRIGVLCTLRDILHNGYNPNAISSETLSVNWTKLIDILTTDHGFVVGEDGLSSRAALLKRQ